MSATVSAKGFAAFKEAARQKKDENAAKGGGDVRTFQGTSVPASTVYSGTYDGVEVLEWKVGQLQVFLVPKEVTARDDERAAYEARMELGLFKYRNADYAVFLKLPEEDEEGKITGYEVRQLPGCWFKTMPNGRNGEKWLVGRLLDQKAEYTGNWIPEDKRRPGSEAVMYLNIREQYGRRMNRERDGESGPPRRGPGGQPTLSELPANGSIEETGY